MIQTLRILRAAALQELSTLAVSRFMLFIVTVQPFFIAVTAMFILRRGSAFDPAYVVVGSALTGLWSLMLFKGNWLIGEERRFGTLELLVGAPTSLMVVAAGKLIGSMVFSSICMVVSYAVGAWLFGYTIDIREPEAFVVSVALALAALWATAMLVVPLGILWRAIGQFLNVFEYPVYMLAGFLFPIAMLPTWSNPASWVLPPFWGATAVHLTSTGQIEMRVLLPIWTVTVLSTIATLLLARPLFALVIRRATAEGTLALS